MADKLKIPPDLYLLIKALIITESIGRKLDPDFDMISQFDHLLKKSCLNVSGLTN